MTKEILDEEKLERDICRVKLEISKLPVYLRNRPLCNRIVDGILPSWAHSFPPATWNKVLKKLPKEWNEAEPAIAYIMNQVANEEQEQKFTLVDVCSGFGIGSMLLSELLDSEKVQSIWLLDKAWPLYSERDSPSGNHISTAHIHTRTWPIPLRIRKMDLKKKRQRNQLSQYIYGNNRVIFLAIHLCKSLSIHAIHLFQECRNALSLVLKPCCLPGRQHLYVRNTNHERIPLQYEFPNGYSFELAELYSDETTSETDDDAEGTDNDNHGEGSDDIDDTGFMEPAQDEFSSRSIDNHHSRTTNARFSSWVQHLERGCVCEHVEVTRETINVQSRHFQNQYLFCQRITTTTTSTVE